MRVLLNDRVLLLNLTGVGHYARQLLDHLRCLPADEISVSPCLLAMMPWKDRAALRPAGDDPTPRQPAAAMSSQPDCANTTAPPSARRSDSFRRVLQAGYRAFFRLRAAGLSGHFDLYHEPNHIPITCNLPTVTTVHDLSVLEHPDWHPADRVQWYEREFARGVRQTTRFIAASEFTRQRMVERLRIPPDRIDVTYQAAREMFFAPGAADPRDVLAPRASPAHAAVPRNTEMRETLRKLDLPERFFLFVGTLEPRKNVPGLLDAYLALPDATRSTHPLVLAGGWGWNTAALQQKLDAALRDRSIRQIGYTADAVLADLYRACTALVWPTFYEGFGLPPLEALACGAPVISSSVASIPEVVGDAGVLLDPHDTSAWTAAMRRVAEDDAWRSDWRQRGPARAARFSWSRCAVETVACYRRAMPSGAVGSR